MRYNYLLEVQVLLKIEFYKSLTMKYHLGWGIFLGTHLTLRYMILISFYSPPSSPLIWLDDCAISHYCAIFYENCAISNLLFLAQKFLQGEKKAHYFWMRNIWIYLPWNNCWASEIILPNFLLVIPIIRVSGHFVPPPKNVYNKDVRLTVDILSYPDSQKVGMYILSSCLHQILLRF